MCIRDSLVRLSFPTFRKDFKDKVSAVHLPTAGMGTSLPGTAVLWPHGFHYSSNTTCPLEDEVTPSLVPLSILPITRNPPPHKASTGDPELVAQLVWWNLLSNLLVVRPFSLLSPSVQITADASPTGWGAHMRFHTIHGHWSSTEAKQLVTSTSWNSVQLPRLSKHSRIS